MLVWPCPVLAKCGLPSQEHQVGLAGEQDKRLKGPVYINMHIVPTGNTC